MKHTIALAAAVALAAPLAHSQTQRHDRAIAVPAPAKVALDGRLDEWDPTAAIPCAYDEALLPRFAMRLCLMYDAEALYIAGQFADDTPMLNRHDPAVEPDQGWAGDALQVRLCSDPAAAQPLRASNSDRICHLTLWNYTDKKLPVLHIQYGMDFHGTKVLTGQEAGVAFRADDDGKGYTLEARIPWKLLNAPDAPRANDCLAFVIQPLWSDGTGWKHAVTFNDVVRQAGFSFQDPSTWGQAVLSPHSNLKPAERPKTSAQQLQPLRLKLPVADPAAASVSAAIYDERGVLVRSLPVLQRRGADADAGLGELAWDGLDDDGRPLPAGKYALKALSHRGIGQKYLLSLHSAGTPPWRTDDNRGAWGGDHGEPIAAAADADRIYLGWGISEAGWAVIAVEPDLPSSHTAQKIWGQHQVLDIGILVQAVALDPAAPRLLFVAQDGGKWGEHETQKATAGVVLWEAATGKPVNFPFGKRTLLVRQWDHTGKEGMNLRGLAVSGERLYASLHHEDKLLEYDWKTGKLVREIALTRPGGLAVGAGGFLYAVSGKKVVSIAPGGDPRPVVAEGLAEPYAVAERDGKLFVTDRGAAMQVKVFDGKTGRLTGTIGKPGGRPAAGRYDGLGMYQPAGLTVDARGRIWVAEADFTPKRVSVWSADGKLIADLLGPGAYAVEGIADPARPSWINTHQVLFEVDYASGAWKTLATLVRPEPGQIQPSGGHMGRGLLFRHAGGNDYLVWRGHHLLIFYRLGADLIGRPVAATGWLKDASLYGLRAQHVGEQAWQRRYECGFRWADRNGDGRLQAEEVVSEKMAASPWMAAWSWSPSTATSASSTSSATAAFGSPVSAATTATAPRPMRPPSGRKTSPGGSTATRTTARSTSSPGTPTRGSGRSPAWSTSARQRRS